MLKTEPLKSSSCILQPFPRCSYKNLGRITLFALGIIACVVGALALLRVGCLSEVGEAWGWGLVGGGGALVALSLMLGCVKGKATFFTPGERKDLTQGVSTYVGELHDSPKHNQTYKGVYVGNDKAGMDMVIKVVLPEGKRSPYHIQSGDYDRLLSSARKQWNPARDPECRFYLWGDDRGLQYLRYQMNRGQAQVLHETVKEALSQGKKVLFYHEPVAKGVVGGEVALFVYQMLETGQTRDAAIADFEQEFSIQYPRTNLSLLGARGTAKRIDDIIPPTVDALNQND